MSVKMDVAQAPKLGLVYIVTLNWNRCEDTLALLESIQTLRYPNFRVVVVDNGSTDDSVERIRQTFPDVIQIYNGENLGFGRGFNRGMQYALDQGADYVFIVNNDTVLDPALLDHLLKYAGAACGILSPITYYASDPERIWLGGGRFLPYSLEVRYDLADRVDGGLPEMIERDFIPACAMLFPVDVLRRVGLFDEAFYLYYEDLDLCRRVRAAGYKILLIPGAKLWHKVSQSSGGKYSVNERYWMARSSVRYFHKYMRARYFPITVLTRAGSAIKLTGILLWRRQWKPLAAYWKGLYAGFQDLRK